MNVPSCDTLQNSEEQRLNSAVQNLNGHSTTSTLVGNWKLLYTTKSDFDPANPLGKREDGTAPGFEKLFSLLNFPGAGARESWSSSSPIQRLVTSIEAVSIYQNIALSDDNSGRVDQLVKNPAGDTVLCLSAAATVDPASRRINFAFDLAYFVLPGGLRLPYPVPFRLLGEESRGYLDTEFVSERLRISRGNKGTTFVLRRVQ